MNLNPKGLKWQKARRLLLRLDKREMAECKRFPRKDSEGRKRAMMEEELERITHSSTSQVNKSQRGCSPNQWCSSKLFRFVLCPEDLDFSFFVVLFCFVIVVFDISFATLLISLLTPQVRVSNDKADFVRVRCQICHNSFPLSRMKKHTRFPQFCKKK